MNKRILSVFVCCALYYSAQAQDAKGGISTDMMQQIKQSYQGTSTDKAIRNAISNNDIRKPCPEPGQHEGDGYTFFCQSELQGDHRPEIVRTLLALHRPERNACQSHR